MISPIGPEFATYIAEHQDMYPKAMREGQETFERLLKSGMCWGCVASDKELLGWVLLEEDSPRPIGEKRAYCYDLAVLTEYQHKGIARQLWLTATRELRWRGYRIHAHCRRSSYELIADTPGYLLTDDIFIESHYAKEYEDDSLLGEHAHEVFLRPIGQ